jgi:hypothetical protein
MVIDEVKRLRNLEQENTRLKKILAERDLEIEVMKEITDKSGERTGSIDPSSVMQSSARSAKDGPVRCFKFQALV